MADHTTCPNCSREMTGQRNFCPYCGHDVRVRTVPEPASPIVQSPSTTTPPQVKAKPSAKPAQQQKRSDRFHIFYPRTIFGLSSLIGLPLILFLGWMLIRGQNGLPSLRLSQTTACATIDPTEFVATRFTRGLSGEISEDTLFGSGEYLIQGTLVVPGNRRLLIQPGARLLFEKDAGIEIRGALYACGNAREPITFTSEAGQPGSWQGLQFKDAAEDSVIAHALIQFGGDRTIYLEDSAPVLQDVKISRSSAFPISSDGSRMPVILNNVVLERNALEGIEIRGGRVVERQQIVWPNSGIVYVVSGIIEVQPNTTLTIEPQTIVKFWRPSGGNTPGLQVRGLLKADNVTFTSVYDSGNEVGGPTYAEARDPAAGDWAGIVFQESSDKSFLRNSRVLFAGQGQGAIAMVDSSPELTNVTIANSAWYPLSADADSFPGLTNLALRDNDPGNALEIRGDSSITGREQRVWGVLGSRDAQIVRVIRGNVFVRPEALLTIEPGVVIKFEPKGKLNIQGTLQAVGGSRDDQRIVFTSLRDGDYGGVTDKNTSPQDSRDWDGILFDKTDETSVMQNVIVRYGSIAFNEASPRILDSRIQESNSTALWATPNSAPTLERLTLVDNEANGLGIARGEINRDQVWAVLGSGDEQVVRILAGNVTVAPTAVLRIEPGTIIKANSDGRLTVNGGLDIRGSSSAPVVFTSIHDDSFGGDTNQKLQGARPGDWGGITAGAQASLTFGEGLIRYAQNGLALRDGNIPRIDGRFQVTNSVRALWCNGRGEMPSGFIAEQNEDNYRQCPSE